MAIFAGRAQLCASLPLHARCMFELGVYLGEIWYLSELANWQRAFDSSRFLLTAPPSRLPGRCRRAGERGGYSQTEGKHVRSRPVYR